MSQGETQIEAMEHQLMRSWASNDRKPLRKLIGRKFRLVVGAAQPVLLDRKSLIDAIDGRWRISSYRFGTVYCRIADGVAVFATEVEAEMAIEGAPWSGSWWMTDIWRKSTLSRSWQLLERQISRPEGDARLPQAVRALQLWR